MKNKRSVLSSHIEIGAVSIPVSIYKCVDLFGLPGQVYHADNDCNGKVHTLKECEFHQGDHEIATYSAIQIDDKLVPLSPDLRTTLLNRNSGLEVIGAYPLKDLIPNLGNSFIPIEIFEVAPQKGVAFVDSNSDLLVTLLQRLARHKKYLLCTAGLAGMQRYIILLPNGRMMALAYREEIRETTELSGTVDKDVAAVFDSFIGKHYDFPDLTLDPIVSRINAWIRGIRRKSTPKTNPKKKTTEKVPA